MRAPWYPESHSHAALDPLRGGHWDRSGYLQDGAVSRFLGEVYLGGAAPGFAAWEYVRPHGPLYHEVKVPGCDEGRSVRIPSAAGGVAFSPRQMVSVGTLRTGAVILGRPPGGLIGASAYAIDMLDGGAFDDLAIIHVSPGTIEAGEEDLELTITGHGFRETPLDVVMAAVYVGDEEDPDFGQYTADPFVTLHDLTWVSTERVTVLADASADMPHGYLIGFAWRRGG